MKKFSPINISYLIKKLEKIKEDKGDLFVKLCAKSHNDPDTYFHTDEVAIGLPKDNINFVEIYGWYGENLASPIPDASCQRNNSGMKKIIEYKLIVNNHSDFLQDKINDLISEGWQPIGSPSFQRDEVNGAKECRWYFCQAMVKYED
jgi:Domain of unknown function (DUF1737)